MSRRFLLERCWLEGISLLDIEEKRGILTDERLRGHVRWHLRHVAEKGASLATLPSLAPWNDPRVFEVLSEWLSASASSGARRLLLADSGRTANVKIGLNLTQFIPGQSGGVQSYIENLVRELLRIEIPHASSSSPTTTRFRSSRPAQSDRCEIVNVVVPIPRPAQPDRAIRQIGPFPRVLSRPQAGLRGARLDVLHFPMGFIVPIGYRGRTVLTSLDIQQEIHPEFFSKKELRWRRKHYSRRRATATHIITISDHTAKSLSEMYGIPRERITTVYPGCEEEFFQPFEGSPRPADLPDRFFFYPAAFWPHKNHCPPLPGRRAAQRERDEFSASASPLRDERRGRRACAGRGEASRPRGPGHVPRLCLPRTAAASLPLRRVHGLPVALRGLRHPGGRGDGRRLPGGDFAGDVPLGDRRGRRLHVRPGERREHRRGDSPARNRIRTSVGSSSRRGKSRAKLFTGAEMARKTLAVYEEVAAGPRNATTRTRYPI